MSEEIKDLTLIWPNGVKCFLKVKGNTVLNFVEGTFPLGHPLAWREVRQEKEKFLYDWAIKQSKSL